MTRPLKPNTRRSPASATNSTGRCWPGSKRTAVPAAICKRMPMAALRPNTSAVFTSKKWKCEPTWIGRSPLLATTSVNVARPSLMAMSPSSSRYSPGIMGASGNRIVNGNELAAVREGGFDLDIGDHFGDAVHDVGPREDGGAIGHQLRHALAVARAFHDGGADQGHRFRVVEFEAARQAPF